MEQRPRRYAQPCILSIRRRKVDSPVVRQQNFGAGAAQLQPFAARDYSATVLSGHPR